MSKIISSFFSLFSKIKELIKKRKATKARILALTEEIAFIRNNNFRMIQEIGLRDSEVPSCIINDDDNISIVEYLEKYLEYNKILEKFLREKMMEIKHTIAKLKGMNRNLREIHDVDIEDIPSYILEYLSMISEASKMSILKYQEVMHEWLIKTYGKL